MAWLSPSYPVGAFSYSSGIEWAVEAGDIKDAESLRRWLAVVIGEGGGFCDAVFFVHAHRSLADAGRRGAARGRRTGRGLRAVEGAPSGNHRAGPRPSSRRRARPGRARALDRLAAAWDWASGLSGRGRRRGRRPRHRARAGAARLSARRHRQPDFGRRAAHPARPDRRPARAGRARAGRRPRPRSARSPPRSTTSAARRSAPTSPACGTKPSTRGCSGHEHVATRPACASASAARSAPARPR